MMHPATDNLTSDEIVRATWLRAVEWVQWPAFVSQPILPILALFFTPWKIFVGLIICGYLWMFIRYQIASYRIATAGCLFVRLKWLSCPAVAVYFLINRRWIEAVFSLCSPIVAQLAMLFIHPTGQIGRVQKMFFKELGFDPEATAVNETMDRMKMMMRVGM